MSSYIVAYTKGEQDHYVVFCHDDSLKRATQLYERLRGDDDVYCANLCEIVDTTEHYEVSPAFRYKRCTVRGDIDSAPLDDGSLLSPNAVVHYRWDGDVFKVMNNGVWVGAESVDFNF